MLHTLGHSNRSLEDFTQLLQCVGIKILVDVRARPVSGRHPHFNGDSLRAACEAAGVTYHWSGRQLGGMRVPLPNSPHIALHEDAFRGYADHMATREFKIGLAQLVNLARTAPTAIMCAEREPQSCHRQFIADALLLEGETVRHVIDADRSFEHTLHSAARRESAALIYDRATTGQLDLQ
jgi:uncharacterized protein (DUF488 family)